MDGDNAMRGLDLNLPLNSGSDAVERANHSSPNDLVSEKMPIEQRLRLIQHLNKHMSKRPRLDQGGPATTLTSNVGSCNKGRHYSKDSSRLVAIALKKERLDFKNKLKKLVRKGGSYYDCNVCSKLAKEPVLTCCGHLFCWSCFYKIPYVDSFAKECPVCVGEVKDSTVIPIYGNGGAKNDCNAVDTATSKIPPRPKARRVETVGPQRVVNRSHVPVVVL